MYLFIYVYYMNIQKNFFIVISLAISSIFAQNAPNVASQPTVQAPEIATPADSATIVKSAENPADSTAENAITSIDSLQATEQTSEVSNKLESTDSTANVPADSILAASIPAVAEAHPADSLQPAPVDSAPDTLVKNIPDTLEVKSNETIPSPPIIQQDQVTEESITSVPVQEIIAVQVQSTPTEKTTHPLNKLHGNAYNSVSNEAASSTIGGDLAIPHKMRGHKLGYFEPVNEFGVISFGDSSTKFLAFDNSENLGLLIGGISFDKYAFSLETAIGKKWTYTDFPSNAEENIETTKAGNLFGGTISAKLASRDVAMKIQFINPEEQSYKSDGGNETKHDIWDLKGHLSVSSTENAEIPWTIALDIIRHNSHFNTTTITEEYRNGAKAKIKEKNVFTDTTTNITVSPKFSIGGTPLESEKGRIFLGLNTTAFASIYDKIDDICDHHNEYGIYLMPNILGEVSLGKHVMAFASANYLWDIFSMRDSNINKTSIKDFAIESSSTTVNMGARFEYEIAALEMTFTKEFLQNPFGSFSDHNEIAISIGAFIMF